MELQYYKWLEIELKHHYFDTNLCSVIQLIPIAETRQLFTNNQILVRQEKHLVTFYVGLNNADSSVLFDELQGLDTVFFELVPKDDLFYNYTKFPEVVLGELLLFKNSEGSTLLQQDSVVSRADIVQRLQLDESSSTPQEGDVLQIKDATGNQIIQETKYYTNGEQAQSDYASVNLNNLPTNTYQIWLNGIQQGTTFFHIPSNNKIGVLQLDIATVIATRNLDTKLSLLFDAREAYWKYKIVAPKRGNVEPTLHGVQYTPSNEDGSNAEPYSFLKGDRVYLTEEQMAEEFISPQLVPFQQTIETHPILSYTYPHPEMSAELVTETVALPNPRVNNIEEYITPFGTKSICATTIVYV